MEFQLVLKKCASTLARPLRNLFHRSYFSRVFPSAWNVAHIQPVPKTSECSNPANYRPIAMCSTLSKIIETKINYRPMAYLELNALFSDTRRKKTCLSPVCLKRKSVEQNFVQSKRKGNEIFVYVERNFVPHKKFVQGKRKGNEIFGYFERNFVPHFFV